MTAKSAARVSSRLNTVTTAPTATPQSAPRVSTGKTENRKKRAVPPERQRSADVSAQSDFISPPVRTSPQSRGDSPCETECSAMRFHPPDDVRQCVQVIISNNTRRHNHARVRSEKFSASARNLSHILRRALKQCKIPRKTEIKLSKTQNKCVFSVCNCQ